MQFRILFCCTCLLLGALSGARAQVPVQVSVQSESKGDDVLIPIGKYLARGDAEALSAWFADSLEMTLLGQGGNSSKAQARQMLKTFFDDYTPRGFSLLHTAGKGHQKYALGTLHAGGESFSITLFLNCQKGSYQIQQLTIERIQ